MKTIYSLAQKALTMALLAMPLSTFAQNLEEGWYQITRNMSASDLSEGLSGNSDILSVFSNITRNDYLYVDDEIVKTTSGLLGIETQRVYGAKYKNGLSEQINTGDVNTYFYVTPVEGKEEAYTIRSYNGHYLHTDGTFHVEPETLYLGPAMNFKLMNTYESTGNGFVDFIASGGITAGIALTNGIMEVVNRFSGYSVGKEPKTFTLDTSKSGNGSFELGDILALANIKLPIGFSVSYQEQSWQQNITEVKKTETDPETGETVTTSEFKRGEYVDARNLKVTSLDWSAITGANLTNYTTLPFVLIRFVLNNFVSDSYRFNKVNLASVSGGGEGILGGIIGAIDRKELVPYTVQIEGWDGTYTVDAPKDYIGVGTYTQATHTNASVIIQSDATQKQYASAPIYNGGTLFAVKSKSLFGGETESSFIDTGDHGCSNVVITPFDYKDGFLGIFGKNCVQDFSKCISAACVDEENHIIHVYFTEPGKTWNVDVKKGKFITRHAPFALNIPASEKEGGIFGIGARTYYSEAYYATAVNDEEVELPKIEGSVIPAHTAVLIKNGGYDADRTYKYTVASKENQALEAPEDNMLHGVCFAHELDADVNAYVLKTLDGKQKFYKLNQEDRMLAPWRAYLEYDGAAESPLRIAGFEDDVVTGVNTVLAPESDNTIYDLSGRRVNTSNGVTIVGGKKVIK